MEAICGGMAPEIWLFDLESLDARNLTNSDANDAQPMWHGSTLYFLSDRGLGERSNIWALDVASNDTDNDMGVALLEPRESPIFSVI